MMRGTPWQFLTAQALFGIPAGMAGGLQGAMIVFIESHTPEDLGD